MGLGEDANVTDEHTYIETPGPLDVPNRRIVRGHEERRWLCSCNATGHWFRVGHLRPGTVDQRLRSGHRHHAVRKAEA